MRIARKILRGAAIFTLLFFGGCSDNFTDPNDPQFGDDDKGTGELNPDVDEDTPSNAQPFIDGVSESRDLVWSDEFSGDALNTSKWTKNHSSKTRNPRPDKGIMDWRWLEEDAFLDGQGKLVLRARKVGDDAMRCGAVYTFQKYEPTYGYFETRLKIAETAKANHTAFWLQGEFMGNVDGTGRDGAEIDVFESAWVGEYTKSVVHIDGYGASHKANTKKYNTPGIHDGYHVYGLNWTPEKLEIYYDGVKKVTYQGDWVPQVPEFVWLSVGASFGDGDFINQPIGILSEATVDYVRVWQ